MKTVLQKLLSGRVLDEQTAMAAMRGVISGEVAPEQIAAFLAFLQTRPLHLEELRGFHRVLSVSGATVGLSEFDPIDVCGTGGDGKQTFNISTLAAFVLAGMGVKVAKHGNYSATSGCGSSDVLEHLGIKFTADEQLLRRQIATAGLCYLHAPLFQPALKTVAPVRRAVGFRTFFNTLGPLLNPARPRRQFIGLSDVATMRLYRYFLEDSGTEFALVHSRDGYDEISLTGAFDIVTNDGATTWLPQDAGFTTIDAQDLDGGADVAEHAAQFMAILNGAGTAAQNNVVIANAAFALQLAQPQLSFAECRARAAAALVSGDALGCFDTLRQLTTDN
jgi:anthranilate phosphoribosyltransferase